MLFVGRENGINLVRIARNIAAIVFMSARKSPDCSYQINAFVEMGWNGILGEGNQRCEKGTEEEGKMFFYHFLTMKLWGMDDAVMKVYIGKNT